MERRVKVKINRADLSCLLEIINLMTSHNNQEADIITMAMNAAFREMAEEVKYRILLSGKVSLKFSECSAIFFFAAFNGNTLVGAAQEKRIADEINLQIEEQLFKSGKYKLSKK
jgi:hypothetical protein